jgi:hypothetical protein
MQYDRGSPARVQLKRAFKVENGGKIHKSGRIREYIWWAPLRQLHLKAHALAGHFMQA